MNYLILFDDGHGIAPITPGKRTPIFPDGTVMFENDFNDTVVALMYKKLKRIPNFDVAFTAEENYDVPLDVRIARANRAWKEHQDFFGKENSKCILISVHANAYGDGTTFNNAKGVSTFCCSSPPAERVLAETIHKHLKGGTTQVDRGVQEICFAILKGNMTSCLVECAFMTNFDEANLLKQEDFRQECADEIVAGILEYFGVNQPEKEIENTKTELIKYSNGMTELKDSPEDLTNEVVDKQIWDITEFTNCVNGPFFWFNPDGTTYSTSILYEDGITYQGVANHYYNFGCPQSVFIVYKDGTVDVKRIYFLSELDLAKVRFAIGGVGLRNIYDPNFYYSPVTEGFKKGINKVTGKTEDQSGVLAKRNKTVLGYNKRLNKCYLLTVPSISHGELLKLISIGEEPYDIAISVDGGGSTFMDALGDYVFQGENTRRIYSILRFR